MDKKPLNFTRFMGSTKGIVLTGIVIGIGAVLLQFFGNPDGTGLCFACFIRDTAGSLGLHRADGGVVFRSEIAGFVLGSSISAYLFNEFRSRGGSASLTRFVLGLFASFGALSFLGCPIGTMLRLGSGNLLTLIAIPMIILGVKIGTKFIEAGFTLGAKTERKKFEGYIFPIIIFILLIVAILDLRVSDDFGLFTSWTGSSAKKAPLVISLAVSIIGGFLAQRSRFCSVGAFSHRFLMKDNSLLWGLIAMIIASFVASLAFGKFEITVIELGNGLLKSSGIAGIRDYVFAMSGVLLSGLSFTLAGGCAGRNLVLAGEGDNDAAIFIVGMVAGSALFYNFGLSDKPACGEIPAMPTATGIILICFLAITIFIGFHYKKRWEQK